MEKKWKNKNFFGALKNAFNGIRYVFRNERNIKIQLIFALLAILLSLILKINLIEFSVIILTIFFVLAFEFINTSIEVIVDMYTTEYNEKAKIAKDVAASAVTLTSICSLIIGCFIFLPKILQIL